MAELPLRPAKPVYVGSKTNPGPLSPLNPLTRSTSSLEGIVGHVIDRPVDGVEKARSRTLEHRLVEDGERTYHAYSADELIEIDSLAHHGRPGLPY